MRRLSSLALLAAFFCAPSNATTLHAANWGYYHGLTELSSGAPYNLSGTGYSITQAALPDPTVEASASGLTSGSSNQNGSFLDYYFEVIGPAATSVPVLIQAESTLSISGNNTAAQTNLQIQNETAHDFVGNLQVVDTCYRDIGGALVFNQCGTISVDQDDSIQPNVVYLVALEAVANTGLDASATAVLDPAINIDPSFSLTDEYSIVLSPGIGDPLPTSVPEPSSLALLACAFAGFAIFRHKEKLGYSGHHSPLKKSLGTSAFTVLLCLVSAASWAGQYDGQWSGTVAGCSGVNVRFTVKDSDLNGTMAFANGTSPSGAPAPLKGTVNEDGTFSAATARGSKLQGKLSDDKLSGTFSSSCGSFPASGQRGG